MATPERPDRVKVVAAVLASPVADWVKLREMMTALWGPIDFEGPDRPFAVTDYYVREMGDGLYRRLASFADLVASDSLVDLKLQANEIEAALSKDGRRTVNVDVGYLDVHKLVLASGKFDGPKIHLGRGVYADLVCRYAAGAFHPYEWTFPDFQLRIYDADLLEMRRSYKQRLRAEKGGA